MIGFHRQNILTTSPTSGIHYRQHRGGFPSFISLQPKLMNARISINQNVEVLHFVPGLRVQGHTLALDP